MDEIMRRALYLTSSGTMSNLFLNIFKRLWFIFFTLSALLYDVSRDFPRDNREALLPVNTILVDCPLRELMNL